MPISVAGPCPLVLNKSKPNRPTIKLLGFQSLTSCCSLSIWNSSCQGCTLGFARTFFLYLDDVAVARPCENSTATRVTQQQLKMSSSLAGPGDQVKGGSEMQASSVSHTFKPHSMTGSRKEMAATRQRRRRQRPHTHTRLMEDIETAKAHPRQLKKRPKADSMGFRLHPCLNIVTLFAEIGPALQGRQRPIWLLHVRT